MTNHDDNDSENEIQINGSNTPPINEILHPPTRSEDLCSILIPMHNNLVDIFSAVDNRDEEFNLPEIVVVGSQSAGKSSVLESLVNRQFLPRGDGLVTRCPIELRLYQTKNAEDGKEWVEFGHDSSKKKWGFNKVGKEIIDRTAHLAGTNKGIVDSPIQVSVYSPNVIPLTVVDLPGMVKIRTGDQPEDIEEQVNKLIYKYISKPSTIILAISSASNDIVTSESIKLAKIVDPLGERTLGVITKIDKAERDSDELTKLLSGQTDLLKYGFIGVRNHSPDDLKHKKSMDMVRDEEETLLKQLLEPESASKNGSKYLASKLSQLLVRHICKRLPGLENKIAADLKHYGERIQALGSDDIPNKSNTMSTTIHRFCRRFNGEFEGLSRNINTSYLSGGAQVKFIFLSKLVEALTAVDPLKDITDDDIAKAILSSGAMESSVSVPEAAYQHLVKTQIEKLLPPCFECVHDVHKELQKTVENCLDPEIAFRFPRLIENLVGAVHKFLSDRLTKVSEVLKYHIEIESTYTSTSREDFRAKMTKLMADKNITDASFAQSVLTKYNSVNETDESIDVDPDGEQTETNGLDTVIENITESDIVKPIAVAAETFLQTGDMRVAAGAGVATAVTQAVNAMASAAKDSDDRKAGSKKQAGKKSDATNMNDDSYIVRSLIQAYFEIVRQSIRDYVPRLLTHSMIYYACDNLQVFLFEQLHSPDKIDDLVRVSEEASRQRLFAHSRYEQLKKGEEIIKKFRQAIDF